MWVSLLAPSPEAFKDSGRYARTAFSLSPIRNFAMTNAGLSIILPVVQIWSYCLAILDTRTPDLTMSNELDLMSAYQFAAFLGPGGDMAPTRGTEDGAICYGENESPIETAVHLLFVDVMSPSNVRSVVAPKAIIDSRLSSSPLNFRIFLFSLWILA